MALSRRQLLALTLGLGAAGGLEACSSPSRGRGATAAGSTGATGSPPATTSASASVTASTTSTASASGATATAVDAVLNIVAHPDDDLLFLSPDLLHDLGGGGTVRTVVVTAGDAGRPAAYWQRRMLGLQAAYAQMLAVPDRWSTGLAPVPGLDLRVLDAARQVSLGFLKLPDGGTGRGFARTGHSSLPRLWRGEQAAITAVDGSATYTRATLLDTLTRLVDDQAVDVVRTQNYAGTFGDGDHGDHHAVAYLVREAVRRSDTAPPLVGYHDYEIADRAPDVSGPDLVAKRAAFFTYARYDDDVCGSVAACGTAKFGAWLTRQYTLGG